MAVRSRRSWTVRSTYQLSCPNCSDYKPAQNNNLQEDFQGLPSNITSNMPMILHCYVHTQRSYSSSTNLSKKNTGQRWKPSSRYPCNQHTGSKRTSLPSTLVTCTVLFFCRQLSSKQLFLKIKINKKISKCQTKVPSPIYLYQEHTEGLCKLFTSLQTSNKPTRFILLFPWHSHCARPLLVLLFLWLQSTQWANKRANTLRQLTFIQVQKQKKKNMVSYLH